MSRRRSKRKRSGSDAKASDNSSRTVGKAEQRTIPLRRKIIYSFVILVSFFVGGELLLRAVGFRADDRVETMQFTFPIDDYNNDAPQPFLERDAELFWKPRAGVLDHNSHGFYGPEFSIKKEPGRFRIVCIGDSCTHFGPDSYPDMLRAVLEKVAPGKYEVINAGVIGYTSYQGKTLLETRVLDWSPDLVTVYFGWNDHWLARGLEDKDQTGDEGPMFNSRLGGLRLYQFMRMLRPESQHRSSTKTRVSLEDYRKNLARIEQLCSTAGIETWFLTAPHALDLSIPPYLYTSGEILDPDGLIPLHRSYNSVVREMGQEAGAVVIDLAAEMDPMDKQALFIDDHIHLSERGRLYVAQRLLETLQQRGLLAAERSGLPQ